MKLDPDEWQPAGARQLELAAVVLLDPCRDGTPCTVSLSRCDLLDAIRLLSEQTEAVQILRAEVRVDHLAFVAALAEAPGLLRLSYPWDDPGAFADVSRTWVDPLGRYSAA